MFTSCLTPLFFLSLCTVNYGTQNTSDVSHKNKKNNDFIALIALCLRFSYTL